MSSEGEKRIGIVELRAMTEAEFALWQPTEIANYAASKVRAGNWPEAEALQLAEAQVRELLPSGLHTDGHRFYKIIAPKTSVAVGSLWVHVQDSPTSGATAFLYEIEIDEEQRGLGYGSAALQILFDRLRFEGIRRLQLHVFGYNEAAQRLYRRLGFEVTNVNMEKFL